SVLSASQNCAPGPTAMADGHPAVPMMISRTLWPRRLRLAQPSGELRGTEFMQSRCRHSTLMPAARITLAHLSVYSTMYLRNSSGEFADTVSPSSAIRCFSAGAARLVLTSWLSFSMILLDVFGGMP